jgi:hypothetical protein
MSKLHTIHYCPVGHRDLGNLISRVDTPNLAHLELEMWTMSDFDILETCRKMFCPATNLTIDGFTFTTAMLGAVCELFPLATHVDLTLASLFLRLIVYASLPMWSKLAQLRIQESALGQLNKMIDKIAIERLTVYCPGEAFTPESIMANIRKSVQTVVVTTKPEPEWHSVVFVSTV